MRVVKLGSECDLRPRANHWEPLGDAARLLKIVLHRIENTPSWKGETSGEAGYSWPGIPAWAQELLELYRVKAALNGSLR